MSAAPPAGAGATGPSVALFRDLADHQGFTQLTEARLATSVATHAAMRDDLLALRAIPLSFLEPVPEPAQAIAWLERGGDRP